MSIYLHYVKNNQKSERLATRARKSFEEHGWDVCLIEGYTPENVSLGEAPYIHPLKSSRLFHEFRTQSDRLLTKLAILSNHIQFWKMTAMSDEPQIYAEHDIICTTDVFELPDFNDVLVLNMNDSLFGEFIARPDYRMKRNSPGVYDLPDDWPWVYSLNNKYKGAKLIPTAGCYALTPGGAAKLLEAVYEGSEQGDMNINSYNVKLQYNVPTLVEYDDDSFITSSFHGY